MNKNDFFQKNIDLKKDEKLLLAFLFSNAFNGSGVFKAPIKLISQMTGIGPESLRANLYSLVCLGKVAYDFENEVCWLFEEKLMPVFIITNSKLYSLACSVSKTDPVGEASLMIEAYKTANQISSESYLREEDRIKKEAPNKRKRGRPSKEEQKEGAAEETETEELKLTSNIKGIESNLEMNAIQAQEEFFEEFFNSFWEFYPRKEAKADAIKAMKSLFSKKPEGKVHSLMSDLLKSVKNFQAEVQLKGTEKRHIKLASGWLRSERWSDFLEEETLKDSDKGILSEFYSLFVDAYPKKVSVKETKLAIWNIRHLLLEDKELRDLILAKAKNEAMAFKGRETFSQCPVYWLENKGWENRNTPLNSIESTMLQNNFKDNFSKPSRTTVSSDLLDGVELSNSM